MNSMQVMGRWNHVKGEKDSAISLPSAVLLCLCADGIIMHDSGVLQLQLFLKREGEIKEGIEK